MSKTPDEIKRVMEYLATRDMSKKLELWEEGIAYDWQEDTAADALAYIRQREAERDAAVKNLGFTRDCKECKHYDCRACDEPCKNCGDGSPCWEWRGLPEQTQEDDHG